MEREYIVPGNILAGIEESVSSGELVRCKDCRHGVVCTQHWNGVQYVECHARDEEGYDPEVGHSLDWFCADGKRKDGDGK